MLSFSDALALLRSPNPDERQLGLVVLFRRHPNQMDAWDAFVNLFVTAPIESIPPSLIHYLAHIPWHGDVFYWGETITAATREHVRRLLSTFGRPEILKLLQFIDQENGISRGTLGQSVEAVITSLPGSTPLLKAIAEDPSIPIFHRECAALIYTMHNCAESLPLLARLAASGSSYAQELLEHVKEYGEVNPYM